MPFKISIITINYNNREGLRKTMESVVSQTDNSFEYIIIDGGSTDGSVEAIEENKNRVDYWVSEKDNGVYHAMNKGIAKATGDYLLFLNSGDYLAENTVLSDVFAYNFDNDIIYGDLYLNYSTPELPLKKYPDKLSFKYFFHLESLPHPSSLIKRSLFSKVGLYNENLKIVGDWEFWLKAIFLHQATYRKVPIPISVFDMSGLCSQEANMKTILWEKEMVFNKYFKGIIEDYRKYEEDYKKFQTVKNIIDSNRFIRILKRFNLLKYEFEYDQFKT